jgi:hypothetical protein
MFVNTQSIIERVLAPMLTANGGPVASIQSLPFRPGELTEQTAETFRVRMPACIVAFPASESFANSAPAVGGQDCYPTTTVRQLIGFVSNDTNAARQLQFVSDVRTGLFRTLFGYVPYGNADSPTGNENQSRIARFDVSLGRFEFGERQAVAEFEIVTVIQFTARGLPYGS